MKLLFILMIFPFFSCSAQKKLQIETILTQPARVTSQDVKTGRVFNRTTSILKTKRLDPAIVMQAQNENKLTFLLQGSISSGGLSINNVKKIRFEESVQSGDTITLKYIVEIKRIPGKEGANVAGYNYTKQEAYKAPKDIKVINIELYEERENQTSAQKQKLMVTETFDLSPNS